MSVLIYNGINFGTLPRTVWYEFAPWVDESSGVDLMGTHHVLEIATIFHPNQLASNVIGGAGDPAGLSVANLRQALATPQRPLIFSIGDNNVVVSPAVKNGVFQKCDINFGPKVTKCNVVSVEGDFSIFVQWRVETWTTGFNNVLLSNRWSATSEIDSQGYTTRSIVGQARMRADAIAPVGGPTSPDDFRSALFIAPPKMFTRQYIRCLVTPDGATLHYILRDREQQWAFGATGPGRIVRKMEGNATAGSETRIKDINTAFSKIGGIPAGGLGGVLGMFGAAADAMISAIPVNKASALIRVYGDRNARRSSLAALAAKVCLDRFGNSPVTSSYCTQDMGSDGGPWCEVRMEFFPTVAAFVGANLNPANFAAMFNMSNDIATNGLAFSSAAGAGGEPPLPGTGGSRGDYVGALAVQTFTVPNQPPGAPPADALANDFAAL